MQNIWKRVLRFGMSGMVAMGLLAGQTGLAAAQSTSTIHFTGYFDQQLREKLAITADSFPVVNVRWIKQDEPDAVYYDVGTSILVAKDMVLTNYHVVQDYAELPKGDEATLSVASPADPEQPIKAAIIKTDPVTDMALLKLEKPLDAQPVTFASAKDNQIVYTIGFPENPDGDLLLLGEDFPSTYNTIAKSRVADAVATDVPGKKGIGSIVKAMAQGNSGGPVLNQNNQVVGMMTFTYGGRTYYITSKTLESFINDGTSAASSKKPVVVQGKVN